MVVGVQCEGHPIVTGHQGDHRIQGTIAHQNDAQGRIARAQARKGELSVFIRLGAEYAIVHTHLCERQRIVRPIIHLCHQPCLPVPDNGNVG